MNSVTKSSLKNINIMEKKFVDEITSDFPFMNLILFSNNLELYTTLKLATENFSYYYRTIHEIDIEYLT